MTETELQTILKSITAALEVFVKPERPLTAAEISLKSMLTVLRSQVTAQLEQERSAAGKNLST